MEKSISLMLLLIVFLCFSCNKEEGSLETQINVQLTPSLILLNEGSDKPMTTKAITPNDSVLYAIQVYENDVEYYYGLFNDISKMQIALTTSKTYKFKISALIAGTGKGLETTTDTTGVNYYLPNKIPLKNKFLKGNLLNSIDLASSIITHGEQKIYPEIDIFYVTKTITLEQGTTNIDFDLQRMGFGLQINVAALTIGKLEVYIGNDTIELSSSKTSATTIRLFNIEKSNFSQIYSNTKTYGDSILIKAKWTNTNGTTVETQNSYYFSRNYQKTINIQLNTLSNNIHLEGWSNIATQGLIAWYPFNGNANDESGNNYHGIVNGASLTSDRFGNPDKAYSFNGISDYIQTSCPGPIGNSERTVSFWAKVSKSTNDINTVLFYGDNEYAKFFSVYFMSLTGTFRTDVGNATKDYKSTSIFDNWHFYTVVFPGSITSVKDAIMYMDGKLLTDFTYQNPNLYTINTGNTYPINIGRSPIYNSLNKNYYNFKGCIDEIRFWNKALTPNEIVLLYNSFD